MSISFYVFLSFLLGFLFTNLLYYLFFLFIYISALVALYMANALIDKRYSARITVPRLIRSYISRYGVR